jgi:hypothetical protein
LAKTYSFAIPAHLIILNIIILILILILILIIMIMITRFCELSI